MWTVAKLRERLAAFGPVEAQARQEAERAAAHLHYVLGAMENLRDLIDEAEQEADQSGELTGATGDLPEPV